MKALFCPLFVLISSLTLSVSAAETAPFKLWNEVQSPELKELHAPTAERFELGNGMIVFLLEDHELPLIDVSMKIRVRDVYEPADAVGLAAATSQVMRSGGSAKFPGDKLDETLENMAASLDIGIDVDSGSASLSVLKPNFDQGLEILVDVLRNPAFPEEKLELFLTQARTLISKRNDRGDAIVGREFRAALYGPASPYARHTEYATLNKINRAAVQAFHDTYFQPNQFILGVVGDFKKEEMLAKIKAAFEPWPAKEVKAPDVAPIPTERKTRVLFAERTKIPQTTFTMGQVVDLRRNSPDYPAIQVMNEILSGSMSARMFTEVRTKKGLAYSVWGYANIPFDRPGVFSCTALTRNEQSLEAVAAVKEEVIKLVDKGVTEKELAEARESIINSFVFNFDTPSKILGRQMTYEYFGYPMDFAEKLLDGIKKVTVADVNRVAKQYIDPEKFVLMGVGSSAGLDDAKSFAKLASVELLDVTIPQAKAEPLATDAKREADGKRIIADAIQAAGGADALLSVTSLRADVLMSVNGKPVHGCVRAKMADTCRVDLAGPFGAMSEVISKTAAWQATGAKVQELKPAAAWHNLRSLLESDLTLLRTLASEKDALSVQALDPSKEGDRAQESVEVQSPSLGRLRLWFDAQTHLLARVRNSSDGQQKDYDRFFSGHKNFGKLTLAQTITDKDPAAPQSMEFQALHFNPDMDQELFSKPERASTPPEK
jgi:zinc protease